MHKQEHFRNRDFVTAFSKLKGKLNKAKALCSHKICYPN